MVWGELELGGKGAAAFTYDRRNGGPSFAPWSSPGHSARSSRALGAAVPVRHVGRAGLSLARQCFDPASYSGTSGSAAPQKTLHASERDTPRVKRLRARGRQTRPGLDPPQLIFLDESGLNLALPRRYERAPRGVRAVGAVPQNYGQSLTVLAAFACHGRWAALLAPGATGKDVFLSFLERVPGPPLRPGAVVVRDHWAAHKSPDGAAAVARVGARRRYLPPDSPGYHPIERAWSKGKTFLRGLGARTRRT